MLFIAKKIFKLFSKILFSAFVLYGYNLIVAPLNLIIPINVFTVSAITILGMPALLSFIVILLVVF